MYARTQEERLPSSSQSLSVRLSMEAIGTLLSNRVAQALQFELVCILFGTNINSVFNSNGNSAITRTRILFYSNA